MRLGASVQIPPTAVGGWFRSSLLRSANANARAKKDNFVAHIKNDLNNPPTSVGGIHEVALSLVVDRI
jgi:hypothetical protein